MDSKEQLAELRAGIKSLRTVFSLDQSLSKDELSQRLQSLETGFKNMIEKTTEEKKSKEDVEKGWSKRMKNVTESLSKVATSATELEKEADTALEEICLNSMLYSAAVSFLFGVSATLDPQRWWLLFSFIVMMLVGSIGFAHKAFMDLLRVRKGFIDLHYQQNMYYELGICVMVDFESAKDETVFGAELTEEYSKFFKLISVKKRVRMLSWTYWSNFVLFTAIVILVPVLLFLNLGAIARAHHQPCPPSLSPF